MQQYLRHGLTRRSGRHSLVVALAAVIWIWITLGAIALLVVFEKAQAGQWERFRLCKHGTGEPVSSLTMDGFSTKATAWINVNTVAQLIALETTDKCMLISFKDGSQAVVEGTENDVRCKILGGPKCLETRHESGERK